MWKKVAVLLGALTQFVSRPPAFLYSKSKYTQGHMTLFRSVLNKRRKADFTVGNIYIFLPIFRRLGVSSSGCYIQWWGWCILLTMFYCSGIYHQLFYSCFNSFDDLYSWSYQLPTAVLLNYTTPAGFKISGNTHPPPPSRSNRLKVGTLASGSPRVLWLKISQNPLIGWVLYVNFSQIFVSDQLFIVKARWPTELSLRWTRCFSGEHSDRWVVNTLVLFGLLTTASILKHTFFKYY